MPRDMHDVSQERVSLSLHWKHHAVPPEGVHSRDKRRVDAAPQQCARKTIGFASNQAR